MDKWRIPVAGGSNTNDLPVVLSIPTPGERKIKNIYIKDGKVLVEYEDTPVE